MPGKRKISEEPGEDFVLKAEESTEWETIPRKRYVLFLYSFKVGLLSLLCVWGFSLHFGFILRYERLWAVCNQLLKNWESY